MEVATFLVWLSVAAAARNRLSEVEEFIEQNKYMLRKKYRPYFHISAPVGHLLGPNGFTHFKGQYHLFYQFLPYGGDRYAMHWGHVVSSDLIHWVYYPTSLIPREHYEVDGCLAGSAVEFNTYLTLFYTGASVMQGNTTVFTQNLAISGDGIIFQKFLYNPILKLSHIGAENMRHPHVWKKQDTWYMMLGSTSTDKKGQLMLYSSPDMYKWRELGVVAMSLGDMGYLWENPDLFELNGFDVLILSVRGIENEEYRFKNLYQTGYVLGKFSYSDKQFLDTEISTLTFYELDAGHDFYAAKTTLAPDGRRLLVAWLGMYDSDVKETRDGWASMLTLIREVSISDNGRLLMAPIRETEYLRSTLTEAAWYRPGEGFFFGTKFFEILVNTSAAFDDVSILFEWNDVNHLTLTYSAERGCMILDRGGVDGVRRADWTPRGHIYWRIFVDLSSIEVFCGEGELVFSSRFYPRRYTHIKVGGETEVYITYFKLKRTIGYDKAVRKILKERFLHNINNINNPLK